MQYCFEVHKNESVKIVRMKVYRFYKALPLYFKEIIPLSHLPKG